MQIHGRFFYGQTGSSVPSFWPIDHRSVCGVQPSRFDENSGQPPPQRGSDAGFGRPLRIAPRPAYTAFVKRLQARCMQTKRWGRQTVLLRGRFIG